MPVFDLPYAGSFQAGIRIPAENPLHEAWRQVARFGSAEFIRKGIAPSNPMPNWDLRAASAAVRIRQAVQFRQAARQGDLLTSPLPLYYSFLNLTRAFLRLTSRTASSQRHGLVYKGRRELLESGAKITQGTFTEFLDAVGSTYHLGRLLTLKHCLARVIELANDFSSALAKDSPLVGIRVEAGPVRDMLLRFTGFHMNEEEFRHKWQEWFPTLKDSCQLATEGSVLRVVKSSASREFASVCAYCKELLEPRLVFGDEPSWYLAVNRPEDHFLNRAAYYFAALFILSSVVRYQPEYLVQALDPYSELIWLLERFMALADRYYPQLMLSWGRGDTVYFCAV